MFNNPYLNNQSNIDRVNNQIAELERLKAQLQQPVQPITQNFQLAPTTNGIKYANTIDDVKKESVYYDTPFFSKDLSMLWIKNNKGYIRAYELSEIVEKDEKDMQIELLQSQVEELKKEMREYNEHITNVVESKNTTDTKWDDEADGEPVKKSESTSIQRVSTSKKK